MDHDPATHTVLARSTRIPPCLALLFLMTMVMPQMASAASPQFADSSPDLSLTAQVHGYTDADDFGVHTESIESLAVDGIFDGTDCSPGKFCPDEPLERWVMAVWLVRILGESPSSNGTRFADVSGNWAGYIERLGELEVTLGCSANPARFCPDDSVTRAQMASLLVRAFDLEPAPAAGFSDTVNNTHELSIDALAEAGITAGCETDPLRYCPDRAVTRAQMATFLYRAVRQPIDRFFQDYALYPSDDTPGAELQAASWQLPEGPFAISVHYCIRDTNRDQFSREHLSALVNTLTETVTVKIEHQSSSSVSLSFEDGEIRSEPDRQSAFSVVHYCGFGSTDTELVVVDYPPTPRGTAGFAYYYGGTMYVPLIEHFRTVNHALSVVVHEIGHSLFNFCHEHQKYPNISRNNCPVGNEVHNNNVYDPNGKSLMSYSDDYGWPESYFACSHRSQAGWPGGPPLPGGTRCVEATGPPSRPRSVVLEVGDETLGVKWDQPVYDGGSAITGYIVYLDDGQSVDLDSATREHKWTGLTNGRSYNVEVAAKNQEGEGRRSEPIKGTPTTQGSLAAPVIEDKGSAVGTRWNWDPSRFAFHAACEQAEFCRNVGVSNLGNFTRPYRLECWIKGRVEPEARVAQWSGNDNSGCYFRGTQPYTVYVKINGHKSNELEIGRETATPPEPPSLVPAIYDAGSAVGTRWNWDPSRFAFHAACEQAEFCRNVGVSNLGNFTRPYRLECWIKGRVEPEARVAQWSGNDNSGCYFRGTQPYTVYVKINGHKSNELEIGR